MKAEKRNRIEQEPLMPTNVFVLAELPQGKPSTGSVEILSRGLATKFDQVTLIDTTPPETWDNLRAFSQDAASYFFTNPGELISAKPLVTVGFLTWETTQNFIDNLILYGQQLNPLVEELLICDISSLLSSQHGKEIQARMTYAGIL